MAKTLGSREGGGGEWGVFDLSEKWRLGFQNLFFIGGMNVVVIHCGKIYVSKR